MALADVVWRLYVPGDVDGASSGDACVLDQVV
jgi:hypothetical protein